MCDSGSLRFAKVAMLATCVGGLLLATPAAAQTRERLTGQAEQAYTTKKYAESSDFYVRLIGMGVHDANTYYNAACSSALANRTEKAFRLLEQAVEAGWKDADHLASDADLKLLHDDPRWAGIRDRLTAKLAQAKLRRPFKTALAIDLPVEKSRYFPFSEYGRLLMEGKVSPGVEGIALGSGKWYELKAKPDGTLWNHRTTTMQIDWEEPRERTIFLRGHLWDLVRINGEEHYGGEAMRNILPVKLRQGKNTIVCDRQFLADIDPVEFPFSFDKESLIAPDIRQNESGGFDASIIVINATSQTKSVTLSARFGSSSPVQTASRVIPAMNSRIIGFRFHVAPGLQPGEQPLRLSLSDGGEDLTVPLQVVGRNAVCQRTFISRFDGMVRPYAINPSSSEAPGQPIMLSLPGGGWDAKRMAHSYEQRSWCHFVSPQFYGANGEGVSRRASLETLERALEELHADPTQIFLVGYSAGGHGVWQIASLNPGLFSGVGASAGWISYFTYLPDYRPRLNSSDPIVKIFERALSEIDVEARFDALAKIPNVALVHGDKDQSVDIAESRRVKQELEKRGVTPFFVEQPGADHGWVTSNADQVDFPPLLDYLKKHARPGSGDLWSGEELPRTWHDLLKQPLVAVYGTRGTAEETEAARTRAFKEADRCRIQFSTDCEVVPDTVPLAELHGKSVLLYGSPSSNGLWSEHPTAKSLLESPAAQKATSYLILGEREGSLWGAVGGKTAFDSLIAYAIDPTTQVYAFPDWVLLNRNVLTDDFKGVLGAGWFDREGKVDSAHSAWR